MALLVLYQENCDLIVAIKSFKIMLAVLDLYQSIYGNKRSPKAYTDNVKHLVRRFQEWQD